MTLVRIGLALGVKNLLHHGMVIAFAVVLFTCTVLMGWVLVIGEEQPTLMSAATGTLYYCGPMFVLFLTERLVARDHADGTSEFLAALPMGGLVRMGVPFVVGLAVTFVLMEGVLVSSALFASRREGVPFTWLLLLHLQCGTYLLAWYALAFAVAHTGRWRWLTWWTFFIVSFSLGEWIDQPFRKVFWHGVLADPIEQARSVPPWDAFPVAFVWIALGVVVAAFLGSWRGGALPSRWFAPSDTRQRASLVGGAVLALALGPLIEEAAPVPDTWRTLQPLDSRHADVRVAGSSRLDDVGREVVAQLDGLGDRIGVESWPTVVLHPASRGQHRHVRRATGRDESLVLLVDPSGPRDQLVRDVLSEVFVRQTGDLGIRLPAIDWLLRGTAGALRPSPALARRLASMEQTDLPYAELERRFGRDLADAVAAEQVAALGAQQDCALEHVLQQTRGTSFFAAIALRRATRGAWLERVCRVQRPAIEPRPQRVFPEAIPLPPVEIVQEGDALVAVFGWPAPTGAVLRRQALDPLEKAPSLQGSWRVQDVTGRKRVHLGFAPNQPAVAELTLYWEPISGFLSSGRGTW